MSSADVHAAVDWRSTLERLGVPESALSGRHTACPACGGRDRFRFDDRHRRGDFYCNGCGAGDGFDLLRRVHGWSFPEAKAAVLGTARIPEATHRSTPPRPTLARPGARIRDLLRTSCTVTDSDDAVRYLLGRHVFPPLPPGCTLRAHPGADYWHDRERVGRFPCLLAPVHDVAGELVSLHATYLHDGRKIQEHEPRKLLGPLTGRDGCAIRLATAGDVLGVAEGIETALAAGQLHDLPTWAAISAAILAKFTPPKHVSRVVIFADRDPAGLEAAWHLRDRLEIPCELRVPRPPAKDWADVLERARA